MSFGILATSVLVRIFNKSFLMGGFLCYFFNQIISPYIKSCFQIKVVLILFELSFFPLQTFPLTYHLCRGKKHDSKTAATATGPHKDLRNLTFQTGVVCFLYCFPGRFFSGVSCFFLITDVLLVLLGRVLVLF